MPIHSSVMKRHTARGLPVDDMPKSSDLAAQTWVDAAAFLPQAPSFVKDENRTISRSLDTDNPQVDMETGIHSIHSGNVYLSMRATPICGLGTLRPVDPFIGINDVPDVFPPGTMDETTSPFFTPLVNTAYPPTKAHLTPFEPFAPPAVILNEESTRSSHQGVLTDGPPVQRHEYIRVGKTPDDSVPSSLPGISREHISGRFQQRALHDQPQKFQKTGNGPATTSWQMGRQPATIRGDPRRRYLCTICGNGYAQQQGVYRHQREVHKTKTNLCRHCRAFKWGRPYLLRDHLKRRHPDIDPDVELEEVKRNSHRTTTSTTHLPREWVSPPSLEHSGRDNVESQLRPPTFSLLPVTNFPPVFPHAFQEVDHDPQPELAEPTIMKSKHEDARQLEALNSTGKGSQTGKDSDDFAYMQMWYQNSQGERTAAYPPFNLVHTPFLTPTAPTIGSGGTPIYATPTVGPSIPTYFNRTLPSEDEFGTNNLAESLLR